MNGDARVENTVESTFVEYVRINTTRGIKHNIASRTHSGVCQPEKQVCDAFE